MRDRMRDFEHVPKLSTLEQVRSELYLLFSLVADRHKEWAGPATHETRMALAAIGQSLAAVEGEIRQQGQGKPAPAI